MSTAAEPPTSGLLRRGPEEVIRRVCGACGLIGFALGLGVALVNEVTAYANESEQRLEGMFTALTLLAMGVLIPSPRLRGFVWLVFALYACLLLLALLLAGR